MPNTDVERIIKISKELGIVGLSEIKSKEQDYVSRGNIMQAKRRLDSPHKPHSAKMAKIEPDHYKGNDFIESDEDETDNEQDEEDDENEDEESEDTEEEDNVEDQHQEDEDDLFLLPEEDKEETTDDAEMPKEVVSPEPNPYQKRMEREKEKQRENTQLIGSIAQKMEYRGHFIYIIGDYIYSKVTYGRDLGGNTQVFYTRQDGSKLLMLGCRTPYKQCKGRAHIDFETMKVIKFPRLHSCTRDPDKKFQIQMEIEMKGLADTTKDSPRAIYNRVCQKNPSAAAKMEYQTCDQMIRNRRKKAAML